jgi:hypothetical protein
VIKGQDVEGGAVLAKSAVCPVCDFVWMMMTAAFFLADRSILEFIHKDTHTQASYLFFCSPPLIPSPYMFAGVPYRFCLAFYGSPFFFFALPFFDIFFCIVFTKMSNNYGASHY